MQLITLTLWDATLMTINWLIIYPKQRGSAAKLFVCMDYDKRLPVTRVMMARGDLRCVNVLSDGLVWQQKN